MYLNFKHRHFPQYHLVLPPEMIDKIKVLIHSHFLRKYMKFSFLVCCVLFCFWQIKFTKVSVVSVCYLELHKNNVLYITGIKLV